MVLNADALNIRHRMVGILGSEIVWMQIMRYDLWLNMENV